MLFPDIEHACAATVPLLKAAGRRGGADGPRLPALGRGQAGHARLPQGARAGGCALLVETRAATRPTAELSEQIAAAADGAVVHLPSSRPSLHRRAGRVRRLWNIRKGLFPSVGRRARDRHDGDHRGRGLPDRAAREATLELQELFRKYGYDEAIIFGHALEGNLHFVFTQDFGTSRRGRALPPLHGRRLRHGGRTATTARSRPSTAPAATWRPSWSWSGGAQAYAAHAADQGDLRSRRTCSTPG